MAPAVVPALEDVLELAPWAQVLLEAQPRERVVLALEEDEPGLAAHAAPVRRPGASELLRLHLRCVRTFCSCLSTV